MSLAFSAPIDALYAATEVNEAAFERTSAILAGQDPPDLEATVGQLRDTIEKERNPRLLRLKTEADKRGVCFLSDDDQASVGLGVGSETWDIDKLPEPKGVDWSKIHDIPLALVTGTNGKSTTVRLMESILKAAGLNPGITSTDYIRVGDEILDKGDYSGPGGARTLLRDQRVEIAVLEVARGGILRRGLGVPKAKAALITNVAEDHLNQYGIDTMKDLVAAKFVVSRAVAEKGVLVLNADDDGIVQRARNVDSQICWYSTNYNNSMMATQAGNNGPVCFVRDQQIFYQAPGGDEKAVIEIGDIPITMKGAAKHNVFNSLGAICLAKALGIAIQDIVDGLRELRGDAADNPGRGNYFDVKGARALVDFAHNVHGVSAIVETVASLPAKRRLVLLGHAGDRSDEEIRGLTRAAWGLRPDHVIITEVPEYLRGRGEGEVPSIIRDELLSRGASTESLSQSGNCLQGVKTALNWATEGDFLLLLVHSQREEVLELLHQESRGA